MAVYIQIKKISETDTEAVYEYLPEGDQDRVGILLIDKGSGKITELKPSAGDENGFYSGRVARKLSEHRDQGQYPEVTCWAS